MLNLVKLNLFLLIFYIFLTTESQAANFILPEPKPVVDKETKIKAAKKKEIYPQKRPSDKKEKVSIDSATESLEVQDDVKEEIFIYPEKKPLVFVQKIDKAVKKSLILSKKDFKIAKETFEAIDKKKMAESIKNIKKSKG